ncbi:MAG: hypothetical protein AB1757_20710 [Acidobacteriota bacterium]
MHRKLKNQERGVALIQTLLIMALLLALVMGISLTAISELSVSNTYTTQTTAVQAAEAGLNHALCLVRNYKGQDFSTLLALRGTDFNTNYLSGNNPFITANAAEFETGSIMIDPADASNPNLGTQLKDAITGAAIEGVYYKVSLIDDEPSSSTASPKVPNFNPPSPFSETSGTNANNPNIDNDNKVVIYSTGTYGNASVTLEGWVGFVSFPAMIARGNIEVSGNAEILGAYGSVHSNSNLIIQGAPHIAQSATATGTVTTQGGGFHIDGFYGGLQPEILVPEFVTRAPLTSGGPATNPRIQDYFLRTVDTLLLDPNFADGAHINSGSDSSGNQNQNNATGRLKGLADRLGVDYASLASALDQTSGTNSGSRITQSSAGSVFISRNAQTGVVTISEEELDHTGWSYGSGSWTIKPSGGPQADNRIVYVVGQDNYPSGKNGGNVAISGNLGKTTVDTTIFATGSIEITGNTNFTSKLKNLHTPELPPFVDVDILMIAVQDVRIRGDVDAATTPNGPTFNGITYCGEQFDLSGNGSFDGQVISYSNPHMNSTPVSANIETGSFVLSLNNGNSYGTIKLLSWRQIKR